MASSSIQNQADPEHAFDQLAPSFASTSALNKLPYDVFINHRGIDVKHTLASTIYNTLHILGFRVFLDVDALQLGDMIPAEIQQAMATASLHIAIFSPNYAQSPWCLAELSFMLKTGTKIIPIFYHVEPSDIRYIDEGKGVYADAFSNHEKKGRYTQEKIDEWRKMLNNISFLYGYTINDKGDEGRLLKMIVNSVLEVLKRVPLEVAKHPVGLDKLVQEFDRATLESAQNHQNVKVAGIVGMGGSGKTTLAKELFNRQFSSFDRSSFIFDVRDAASKNALLDKQKKLLSDLGVTHLPFDSVDEGKGVLANRLSSLRMLIILDDVDHIDQLDALLPHATNLGPDSLAIVTSRELGVLTSWPGVPCIIYKMPELNFSHAQQLFCWHAFLQPIPPPGFEELVENFLTACKGLPLSLKVFGGHLYGKKSKEYWVSQLNKISRILPTDIKERLQISYNALDEEEQQIFLDVACFFIGEEKGLAIAAWDGSGWSGLYSLETLVNKCLVELDKENRIKMHDHLRDMGREIAASQSPHRFWLPDQILKMKKQSQDITLIRGINATMNDGFGFHQAGLQNCLEQFVRNSRTGSKRRRSSFGLEILHVESTQLTEELATLSEDLVWLRWNYRQQQRLPSWLSLRNLRVLELYTSADQSEELWEDNVDPPLQLRELRIGVGRFFTFPTSTGCLKQLKKIIINRGFCGSSLPEEFCGLQSLEHLELRVSKSLSSLPARLGDLKNLRHVNLWNCSQLRMLPDSFKQLIHLEYLNLSGCEMISSLLASFGNLTNLQHINLSYCEQLTVLPVSFKQLIRLEYLDFEGCVKLKLRIDMLENITKLQYLNLGYCWELEEMPRQITNQASLKELDLSGCWKLKELPTDIGQL